MSNAMRMTGVLTAVIVLAAMGCATEVGSADLPVTSSGSFESWRGTIVASSADDPYRVGAGAALGLEGPSENGRFRGEWRQLSKVTIPVEGARLADGRLRLLGENFAATCREGVDDALACAIQASEGEAQAELELEPGESGDEQNPDCVSCQWDSFCCQGTGECCTFCAPLGSCGLDESIP